MPFLPIYSLLPFRDAQPSNRVVSLVCRPASLADLLRVKDHLDGQLPHGGVLLSKHVQARCVVRHVRLKDSRLLLQVLLAGLLAITKGRGIRWDLAEYKMMSTRSCRGHPCAHLRRPRASAP
jgi:hypothetical protein